MSYSTLVRNMVKHSDEDILNGSLNLDHLDLKTWTKIYNWMNLQDVLKGAWWPAHKKSMFDLWVTSDFLMVDELTAEIDKWFISKISEKTAVEIHNFAKQHFALNVQRKCESFLMENFEKIKLQKFHLLEFGDMVKLLQSNELNQTEEEIAGFIKRVTKSNLYMYQESANDILQSCIRDWRLPCLPRTSKELVLSFGGWTKVQFYY